MKAYTDISQSRKLAKILPIETCDMNYWCGCKIRIGGYKTMEEDLDIPAWSLVALLNVLPSSTLDSSDYHYYRVHCRERFTEWRDNAVDACYEMILRLHKEGLL